MTKIAVLSDIHGNTTALEAVLDDAKAAEVDQYWLLGDILMPGTGRRRILDLLANRLLLFENNPNKKSLFLNLELFQKSKIEGSTNDCQNSSYPSQEWDQSNRTTHDKQDRGCRRHTFIILVIDNRHNS